jgi:hypothetical protein
MACAATMQHLTERFSITPVTLRERLSQDFGIPVVSGLSENRYLWRQK